MATSEIPLTQGLVAKVDAADAEWLNQWKWSASACHRGRHVAVRRGEGRTVYMHREILGLTPGDGLEADHLNHNILDNRRANLRVVTPAQNKEGQPSRGGSSRFVGVTWDGRRAKWRAQIQVDGKMLNLGRFPSEIDAARARDAFVVVNNTGHRLNLP